MGNVVDPALVALAVLASPVLVALSMALVVMALG